jgi:hypothetical protein
VKKSGRSLLALAVVAGAEIELGPVTGAEAHGAGQAGVPHQGSERLHDLNVIQMELFANR